MAILTKIAADRGAFLRKLGGAVAVQAIISASNFAVGLLLVRRTTDADYGSYVLVATSVLLSTTLQGSFIQPPMINRLTRTDQRGRASIVGSLLKDQGRLIPFVAVVTLLVAASLAVAGRLTLPLAGLLVAGTAAVITALRREFFRMVLFAYRRPNDVLKSDAIYCLLLVGGAFLATLCPHPAAIAALTLAVACLAGAQFLSHALRMFEPWDAEAAPGMLREIAPEGAWSAFGGGVHWLFSQGYNYVVAAALNVTAVAALAATRLLVMPVGLLSTGIGTLMLPTVSQWTNEHGANKVLRRIAVFALGLALVAALYLGFNWIIRDWIFERVLRKSFPHRDLLIALWSCIALVTVLRDQLLYFLVSRARFRLTSMITLASALASFAVSLVAMRSLGAAGALLGLLAGEALNVAGIIYFSWREARESPAALREAGAG